MSRILLVTLFIFFWYNSYSQKKIFVQNTIATTDFINQLNINLLKFNLKDLRTTSDSLNIRIWQPNEIFTLNKSDSISS